MNCGADVEAESFPAAPAIHNDNGEDAFEPHALSPATWAKQPLGICNVITASAPSTLLRAPQPIRPQAVVDHGRRLSSSETHARYRSSFIAAPSPPASVLSDDHGHAESLSSSSQSRPPMSPSALPRRRGFWNPRSRWTFHNRPPEPGLQARSTWHALPPQSLCRDSPLHLVADETSSSDEMIECQMSDSRRQDSFELHLESRRSSIASSSGRRIRSILTRFVPRRLR
jgi:hypothetical protein